MYSCEPCLSIVNLAKFNGPSVTEIITGLVRHTLVRLLVAGAASLAISVAFCATLVTLPGAAAEFLNSDALYLPALFRDLDAAGLSAVASWNLTPSPYVFPDMLIYAAADGLTGNFRQEIFLYAVLQIWLFFIAGWLVCRELTTTAFAPYMVAFWLVMSAIVFGGYAVAGPYTLRWYIYGFLSGHHFGALIVSLFAFQLMIACVLRPAAAMAVASAAVLAALIVAAILSDLIFVPYFCIPALAVLACLAMARELRRRAIVIGLLVTALTVAGYVLNGVVNRAAAVYLTSIRSGSETLWAFWSVLVRDAGAEQMLGAFVLAAVAVVTVAALNGAIMLLRDRPLALPARQQLLPFTIFVATASIVIVIVVIGTRVFVNLMTIRYVLPFAFLPPLWLAILLAGWVGGVGVTGGRRGLATVMVLGLPCALWSAWWFTRTPLNTVFQVPPTLACFDGADRTGGLAGYWQAKPLMLFSDDRVRAVQVDPTGAPMLWINNNSWYTEDDGSLPRFSFILMDELNEQAILARYGVPDRVETCGASRIWRYGDSRNVTIALLQNSPLQTALTIPADIPPYLPGQVLDFSLGHDTGRPYRTGGWSTTEPWGIWSSAPEARLILPAGRMMGSTLRLRIQAQSFLADALPRQEVEVVVNGQPVGKWEFTTKSPAGERTAVIPAEVTGLHDPLQVDFRVPTAASPASLGMSADARQLGIGLQWLRLDLVGPEKTLPD